MECFTVYADEIEGRLDPFYYKEEYYDLKNALRNCPYILERIENLLVELYRYPTFYGINFRKEGVPVIKVVNITKEGILKPLSSGEYDFIEEEVSRQFFRTILQKDDLVMAVRGATIGKIAIIPREFEGANINPNLIRISVDKEKINPHYFWIYFNTTIGQKLFLQQVANTAKQTITAPQIRSLELPLPPIKIQNKIVQLVGNAYEIKKQKETEAQQLLDSINDYVLSELGITHPPDEKKMCYPIDSDEIEGRFDPHFYRSEFRILEENLSKSNHKNLSSVIEFSNETWNQKDFFENEFPYIEISEIDITSGDIQNITYYEKSKAPSRAKMIVRKNDIIVSTTRPHRGAITLIDKDKDGFIASTGFAILREPKIDINKKYLLFFLRTQLALKQMLRRSSGGNYPAITSEELKNIIIPLPPLETQNKIANEVKARMQKAEQLKKEAKAVLEEAKERAERIILGEEEI